MVPTASKTHGQAGSGPSLPLCRAAVLLCFHGWRRHRIQASLFDSPYLHTRLSFKDREPHFDAAAPLESYRELPPGRWQRGQSCFTKGLLDSLFGAKFTMEPGSSLPGSVTGNLGVPGFARPCLPDLFLSPLQYLINLFDKNE